MARQQSKIQANSFRGGFISEASPLTFPEESAVDIDNLDINFDGSVRRRKGLGYESNHQHIVPGEEGFVIQAQLDVEQFAWRNAGGDSNSNFVVVKSAEFLSFFTETDSVSSNKHSFEVDLRDHAVGIATDVDIRNNRIDVSYGRGYMFVAGRYIEPLIFSYDPVEDEFEVNELDIRIRDLEGRDDGLEVDERPTTLSDDHRYNLENQGWNSSRINQYRSSRGRYPSNADIWHAGKDSDLNFSPVLMNRIDFGNTPAPKGRKIVDVFDTSESVSVPVDPINITDIDSETHTFTLSSNHTLQAGQEIVISGNEVVCDGTTYSYDGSWVVVAVPTADSFQIETTEDTCDEADFSVNDYGQVVYNEQEFNVGDITALRPTSIIFFAGRAFYAGIEGAFVSDNLYFSQIVTDVNKADRCYQAADPTSEEISDLLDNDGGVITIPGMGDVATMDTTRGKLILFTSTGVWEVSGSGEGYFTATDYATRRISSLPVKSPKSVVNVEGSVFFWAEDGIYVITENEVSGFLQADSLTDESIKSFYTSISFICRQESTGVYDYKKRKIFWWYQDEDAGCGKFHNKALVFDLNLGCFYKYSLPFNVRVMSALAVRNISSPQEAVKYIYTYDNGYTFVEFNKEIDFVDLDIAEQESFVITGYATMGDIGVKKSARQIILHFLRTESGFEENSEGGLDAIHPSSCKVRVTWDWTTSPVSNKWGAEFQGYRYRQLYTPENVNDLFDTGYEVITTKTKLRGSGRALAMHIRSEPGKDFRLLGWSIAGDAEAHE